MIGWLVLHGPDLLAAWVLRRLWLAATRSRLADARRHPALARILGASPTERASLWLPSARPLPARQEPLMTTTPTEPLEDQTPLFGARSAPLASASFRLAVYPMRRPNAEPEVVSLSMWAEPDTGSVMTALNATTEGDQSQAVLRILTSTLRDDDGVSVEYERPREPMTAEEFDDYTAAHPELGLTRVPGEPGAELEVLGEEFDDEEVPAELAYASAGAAWWLGPDGPTVEVEDLIPAFNECSSARRFALLMLDRTKRLEFSVLSEIADHMVRTVTERPTKRPRSSRPGPPSTGGGYSGGRPVTGSSRPKRPR